MTEEELYEKLMSDKKFNNLSPVTKEKLFNSYIKPFLEAFDVLNKDYSDELINSEDLAALLNIEKIKIKKLYTILLDLEKENERLIKEISILNKDYTAEVMGSQKIKKQLERRTLVLNIIAKSDPIGVGLDEITDIAEKGLDDD